MACLQDFSEYVVVMSWIFYKLNFTNHSIFVVGPIERNTASEILSYASTSLPKLQIILVSSFLVESNFFFLLPLTLLFCCFLDLLPELLHRQSIMKMLPKRRLAEEGGKSSGCFQGTLCSFDCLGGEHKQKKGDFKGAATHICWTCHSHHSHLSEM